MTLNRSFGLSLVAAALLAAYGCGKEEPKQAATPAPASNPQANAQAKQSPEQGPNKRFSQAISVLEASRIEAVDLAIQSPPSTDRISAEAPARPRHPGSTGFQSPDTRVAGQIGLARCLRQLGK